MDLSFLDKSSHVTPLLVRLYDTHRLYGLAEDKRPLARAELTRALSDLLQMELTPREAELVSDVMIGLLRQAERDLRSAVSEHISAMDNVPLRLVLQMANDEIDVARPVLQSSPILTELDLIYIVKAQDAQYWREIAKRESLSDKVIDVLSETDDFMTSMALVDNVNIKLTENAVSNIAEKAKESDLLAKPLLRRDEVPSSVVSALYSFVGQELKTFIIENFDIDTDKIIDTVDDLVIEFTHKPKGSENAPSRTMLDAAQRFKDKGMLNIKLMLSTLRRGQLQSFIAQFSCFTNMDVATVETILKQSNGQGLAVACRAYDIQKPDFVSIFLLTNKLRTANKVTDMKDMNRAIGYFNKMTPDIARSIMQNSKGQLDSIQ